MSKQKNNSDYIATWIGKSNKIAQKDYKREIDREGDVFFWDDTKKGHATVGKYFCFINATSGIKEDIIISVHKILTITKKDDRLKEWSKHGYIKDVNYDTSKRSLLTIEKMCLKKIKWNINSQNGMIYIVQFDLINLLKLLVINIPNPI